MFHRAEILLVGECVPNVMALEQILRPLDVTIEKTTHGLDAISEVIKREFAVAIVDAQSSDSGGIETVRQLKDHSLNRELPIILLTTIEDLMEEGYARGAVDYLVKPFDAFVLKSKVKRFSEMHLKRVALRESSSKMASAVDVLEKTKQIHEKNEVLLRLANEELRTLATKDPLTGLLNRREGMEILSREMNRIERTPGQCTPKLSVLMVDVDHFKMVNDIYGHFAGDAVLVEITRRLRETCRTYDRVIRWGGEEMLVVCPDTSSEDALNLGERFRKAISGSPTPVQGVGALRITASFGAACTEEFPGCTVRELLDFADRALYQAKNDGRDCVRKSTPPPPSPQPQRN